MVSVFRVRRAGRIRWVLLGVLLLLLGACSAVKVAYNHADLYLRWKAEEYFALEGEQQVLLGERLDAITSWHRREELPRYSALLLAAQDRVGGGLTDVDLEWFMDAARTRYEALVRHTAPDAAEVLGKLSAAQMARFEARLKRENSRFAEEYVAPPVEIQRQKRYETTLDTIEDWTGPLSEAQRARVKELSVAIPLTHALRHADRQRRQRELISILQRPRTQAERATALEAWLLGWDQGRAPDYESSALQVKRQAVALVLELDRSLTLSQRSRVQSKLAGYAAEFNALASGSPERAAAIPAPLTLRSVSVAPEWGSALSVRDRRAFVFPIR